MYNRKFVAGLVVIACFFGFTGASRALPIKTDIVFMIDATVSMAGEISGVRNGFSSFVSGLNAASVDARFAVVVLGGTPELILDLTSDQTATQTALNNIVIGANPGIHNNHNLNPEAGLEAIRMALGAAPESNFANNNIPQDGMLDFRSDARINLILATDEDSDRPANVANRLPGQTSNEPPSPLDAAWQAEVDATAQAIINSDAFINMLINRSDPPSVSQYGDPNADVSDADLLNFDADATLANLLLDPLTTNSLQVQVLQAGLVGRSFDVGGANDSDFVDNFFAAKVQEIVDDPQDPTVPEPGTVLLIGLGLAAMAYRRQRIA